MSFDQYRPTGFRVLPPVVKNLLILNGLFFLATYALGGAMNIELTNILGLRYFAASEFSPYQFITYMFMHGGISHIIFNMFALWMFGSVLENVWGPRRFITYYLVTGIGAALIHYLVLYIEINPVLQQMNAFLDSPSYGTLKTFIDSHKFHISPNDPEIAANFQKFSQSFTILQSNPVDSVALQNSINFVSEYKEYYLNLPNVIGASGAVFGLLLAFGMLFPNSLIYLYFLIPIKAKWFVIIFGVLELYFGFSDTGGNVAHFAHLGGMIFGYFMIVYWRKQEKDHQTNQWN